MPVKHDSPEWQGIIQDVATLKGDVSAIRGALSAQASIQNDRHTDNQDRFRDLEDQIADVRSEVSELKDVIIEAKGVLEGIKAAAHVLKWLLGIAIAMQTVYMLFGPMIRKQVGVPNSSIAPTTQGKVIDHSQLNAKDE